jgi:hypothetical protein
MIFDLMDRTKSVLLSENRKEEERAGLAGSDTPHTVMKFNA